VRAGATPRGPAPPRHRAHRQARPVYREARALAVKVGDEIFGPLERSERAQLTEMLKRVMDPLWGKPK
jgi:hypothetical protein